MIDAESHDYTKLWNEYRERFSLVKGGKLTAGQGSFNHIAGGYDAGYYGCDKCHFRILSKYLIRCRYTYSLVFAADMYATNFKADPLDPARGQKYREKILLPGGSQDDIDSLKVIIDHGCSRGDVDDDCFFCVEFLGTRTEFGCVY